MQSGKCFEEMDTSAVPRKNFRPTHSSRICGVQFWDKDFINNEAWVLKKLKLHRCCVINFSSFFGARKTGKYNVHLVRNTDSINWTTALRECIYVCDI